MLIAEIGNNHLGDFEKAKELIRVAKESGAHIVKSQAFLARDIRSGSMPQEFYRQCEFEFDQYVDLIQYARSIGIDMFYSIFSKSLDPLVYHQNWHKIAGAQVKQGFTFVEKKDTKSVIVSIPEGARKPVLHNAHILHVSSYLTMYPGLENITYLSAYYKRSAGYSDHTVGVDVCIRAYREFQAPIIEKHFTVSRDISFNGVKYRDCVHAADPKEMEILAKVMEEKV